MLSPIPLLGMVDHACNPNALGNFRVCVGGLPGILGQSGLHRPAGAIL